MLSFIALAPALVAFYFARKYSVEIAFIKVYLPSLLLLPGYYMCLLPGLPDPTFNQGTAMVVFAIFAMQGFPGYRYSSMDLVIFAYAFVAAFSEYRASGYSDAQNLMFANLAGGFVPYILAKSLIEPKGLRYEFAKVIVICACIVCIFNLWENRFGFNVWRRSLDPFFPGQGLGWITTFRFGVARAGGPYAHALLAGIMMIVAFRFQRWLHWSGAWPEKFTSERWKWIPISPALLLSLWTTLALLTTVAKGSWLASIIASSVTFIGKSKQRSLMMVATVVFLVGIGIPVVGAFLSWASVGRENALTDNQETAAYRYELIEEYMEIGDEKEWFGWGLTAWPKVPGMESIDNYFLLLYLMHGKIAVYLLVYILFGTMIRLIVFAMKKSNPEPLGSSLAFTMAAIYLGYIVAIATVFMGFQTATMIMMITGWAEAYMRSAVPDGKKIEAKENQVLKQGFQFRRVL